MERSDGKIGAQESTRGGAWQVGRPGPQRGQAARKSGERAEGRVSQKPPQDSRLSSQRAASSSSSPRQAVTVAMALIRGRFGDLAIGLGEAGLRYGEGRAAGAWHRGRPCFV
jgi:hypothetical protein